MAPVDCHPELALKSSFISGGAPIKLAIRPRRRHVGLENIASQLVVFLQPILAKHIAVALQRFRRSGLVAGVEDYQVALATYRAACERWPGTPITSARSGSAPGVSLRKHQRRLASRRRFLQEE
jgi:hypothetical protein